MTSPDAPWYRQPWLWFILSPLIVVMIAGFSMMYLAISTHDGVVVDNFYKDGLSIHTRSQQDQEAVDRGLAAKVMTDQQRISLKLSGNLETRPAQLTLLVIFPTQDDHDHSVRLIASGDLYTGVLPENLIGRRLLQLQPADVEQVPWRLHGETVFPVSGAIELVPRQPQGS